jgi:hypothetical protein
LEETEIEGWKMESEREVGKNVKVDRSLREMKHQPGRSIEARKGARVL